MKSASDPKENESADSRKKLIQAAVELFSSRGFHAVSVREICDRAKLNISLISYYFSGKDGLLVASLDELAQGQSEKVANLLGTFESQDDFRKRLSEFLHGMVKMYLDNTLLMKLFFEELEKGHKGAERVYSETFFKTWEIFNQFIQKGRQAGYLQNIGENDRILTIIILTPFLNLMRTQATSKKFYQLSLADKKFRDDLIEQVLFMTMKPLERKIVNL